MGSGIYAFIVHCLAVGFQRVTLLNEISWTRLSAALEYYRGRGFKYAAVPWIVSAASLMETMPVDGIPQYVSNYSVPGYHGLVGSGEQGFIESWCRGELDNGSRLMTITPCFRHESVYDSRFTLPWFMKLELMVRGDPELTARDLAELALRFMGRWQHGLSVIQTGPGWDVINPSGIELGSYGWRDIAGLGRYVYGTGLAEPRFTNSLEK